MSKNTVNNGQKGQKLGQKRAIFRVIFDLKVTFVYTFLPAGSGDVQKWLFLKITISQKWPKIVKINTSSPHEKNYNFMKG